MHYPRIMIAGTHSGVGKTTVSLGLMRALAGRGHTVQPFKVGPDYIDPGLHHYATGRYSHNLDSWMGDYKTVQTIFTSNSSGKGISVIEGVMGLYDGSRGEKLKGSSAEIALMLKTPVLLVVNASGMAQSCVALIKGYQDYCPELDITGVIMNRSTNFHRSWVKANIEEELGLTVLGCLERETDIVMPQRHLGLLPAEENNELANIIDKMAVMIEAQLDLDTLWRMANSAPEIEPVNVNRAASTGLLIGVANDEAFTFYYRDSLDYLEELGAKLVYFSPLRDQTLPDVDALYMGGGFPEMFLPTLSSNKNMLRSLRKAREQSMPIFAECGAYMYLAERIIDWDGKQWEGAGIIPLEIKMTRQLQALGYVEATALQDSVIARCGEKLRGHEFHYSKAEGVNQSALRLSGGRYPQNRIEGYVNGNVFGSYLHLHLRSNPQAACNFLEAGHNYHNLVNR